jgi:NADH-quinone oxidoreductase subunit C
LSKSAEQIHQELEERFPGKIKGADLEAHNPFVIVEADSIAEVAVWLRDEPEMAFDMLHCLSGVDYPKDEKMEVVYHLFSLRKRHWIVLKVEVPRAVAVVPTVENVWKTANWHEREIYDLYGIRFGGHSDLRRIFLPDDWEGHPLRKDWEWPDKWHGIPVKASQSLAERAEEGQDIGVGPFD